jgi:hypothetical protein
MLLSIERYPLPNIVGVVGGVEGQSVGTPFHALLILVWDPARLVAGL